MALSMQWLPAAVLSLFSFGIWGLFTKLTVDQIDSKSALLYQSIGIALVGVFLAFILKFKPDINIRGMSYGILTGIANGVGCLFFLVAASRGKITPVVTMTALYPIVTIALAFLILHEAVTIRQGAGILLALTAIYLLC